MFNRNNAEAIIAPEQVHKLIVQPVIEQAICTHPEVSNRVEIPYGRWLRIPVVTKDPSASWVEEGAEIAASTPTLKEVGLAPAKVAAITRISHELLEDSNPSALEAAGEGLVRDLSRKIDEAFFSQLPAPAPQGLESLPTSSLEAPLTNTDPFVEAISIAAEQSSQITSFVTNPAVALQLAKVKRAEGSNEPLLQPDPTAPARNLIAGVPLYTSPSVADNTIWAIPSRHVFIGIREDSTLESSKDQEFTSDIVLLKARMRLAFGFTHPQAIVKITATAEGA